MLNRYLRTLQDFRKSKWFVILSPVLNIISKWMVSLCLPWFQSQYFHVGISTYFLSSLLDSGEVWQNRQSSSLWAPLDGLWASLHHCTHTPLSCHEPPLGICSYRPWPGLTWALTPHLSKRMWTFPDGEKGWDLLLTSLSYFLYCDPGHLTL